MVIKNEKGQVFQISGPNKDVQNYWDPKSIKYDNFDNYGKPILIDEKIEKPAKIVQSLMEEKICNEEIKIEEKIDFKIVEINPTVTQIIEPKIIKKQSIEENENLSEYAGCTVVFLHQKTQDEYQIYAKAVDVSTSTFYFNKSEFNIIKPTTSDKIICDWLNITKQINEIIDCLNYIKIICK